MPSIIPPASAGGVVVRDAAGNCHSPPSVPNAYCPGPNFNSTCEINYLPEDCTARITVAQINAFQSELLCLAEAFRPQGTWDCDSLCNLGEMFTNWATSHRNVSLWRQMQTHACAMPFRTATELALLPDAAILYCDGEGNIVRGDPVAPGIQTPQEVADGLCGDEEALATLVDCLPAVDVEVTGLNPLTEHQIAIITNERGFQYPIFETVTQLTFDPNGGPGQVGQFIYRDEAGVTHTHNLPSPCDKPIATEPEEGDYLLLCRGGNITRLPIEALTPQLITIVGRDSHTFPSIQPYPANDPGPITQSGNKVTTITNPSLAPVTVHLDVDWHIQLFAGDDDRIRTTGNIFVDGVQVISGHVIAAGPQYSHAYTDVFMASSANFVIAPGQTVTISSQTITRPEDALDVIDSPDTKSGDMFLEMTWYGVGLETWQS